MPRFKTMLSVVHVFASFLVLAFPMSKPLPHEQNEVKTMSSRKRQSHQP